ncbi:hypothetical protein METUNv1_02183 [Methyloversatilis universalis FAM5]|uniref:Transmembrane protein n=1 Tax=Methyloversatilis universalis (strain ATCC BAA-1314 / DSM 25237 / JCM 13912 / CCUG 52030 / FAM5) TaxID=1000565 RepID=F5RD25_METUF|nr:hypothetical protein METUNv1_02183 [Methyloversatilis universalis FAM5]
MTDRLKTPRITPGAIAGHVGMNCNCPLCGENISRRRLKKVALPGESSWLAFRWFLECPACTGALQLHPHPFECAASRWVLIGVAILNGGALLFGVKTPLSLALLSMALVAFGPFIGRALVVPADWPRYAPHASGERKA